MWHSVVWKKRTDVSENPAVSLSLEAAGSIREATRSSEMSVHFYQTSRRRISNSAVLVVTTLRISNMEIFCGVKWTKLTQLREECDWSNDELSGSKPNVD